MNAASILAAIAVTWSGGSYESACMLGRVDRSRTSSQTCLACHDGSVGPVVGLHDGLNGSHSVGVAWAAARQDASLRRYGPRDARVVLPRGRVECVSCHAMDGTGRHWTVEPFDELCAACHDK